MTKIVHASMACQCGKHLTAPPTFASPARRPPAVATGCPQVPPQLHPQSRPAASTASSPPPPAEPAGWQQRGGGGSGSASPDSGELETCRSLESFHSLATTAQFTALESMLPRSESDLSSLALEEVTALADEAAALQRRLGQMLRLARAKMLREGGVGSFLPSAVADETITVPGGPSSLAARAGDLLFNVVLLALAVLEAMLIRAAVAVEAATCGAVRLRGAARLAPALAARVFCLLFVLLELLLAQLRGWLPNLF